MGKYLSVIIGILVAAAGILLFSRWFFQFKIVAKGCIPPVLVFAGVISVLAGLSELSDTIRAKEKK